MTPPLAASVPANVTTDVVFVAIGLVVFLAFLVASRLVASFAADQLHKRHLPTGMVTVGRRVVAVVLLGVGVLAALGFAIQSANVTLLGILFATVVAAFGVQDLLRDYVSGYYVLLERHFRVGDRISLEGERTGTITEVKLRVTLLRNDSGDLIVVPNAELFGRPVTVHAHDADEEPKPAPPA
ncbi:MAG: mechanosensitive ion channel family protein [Candidatus Dormibacteraeota bacterium]|jgi:small conductance mechanosensitive channel|nr:mechanosensitive ion channel family protein [Candidatus Dormibacteraeota bacterium]